MTCILEKIKKLKKPHGGGRRRQLPRGEFNATVLDNGRGVAAVAFVVTVMAVAAAARRRAGAQWEHQHLVWFDGFHVGCYGGFRFG